MKQGYYIRTKPWFIWFIPMIVMLGIFYLYPLLEVFRLSFTDTRIDSPSFRYTLESFQVVLSDSNLLFMLKITIIYVAGSVFFQLLIGLIVGLLLNYEFPGVSILKGSMIAAWVVPGIVTGIVWQILFSSGSAGLINAFLKSTFNFKISFLGRPSWALFAAIISNIWRGTGFSGLMQYAAIKSVPMELLEAASLDGATRWQRFRAVILPHLKPMIMINIVLITIATVNTYDSIFTLTKGGPGIATTVLALQTYKSTFFLLSLGRGAVYAVLLVCFSVILTIIYLKILGDKNEV